MTRLRRAASFRSSSASLPDRAHGVDDGRARRVRHEGGQRLQRPGALRIGREGQHVGLLRREARHRRLQGLQHALAKQRDLRGRLAIRPGKRQRARLARRAQRLEVRRTRPPSLRHRVRDVGHPLRPLADRDGGSPRCCRCRSPRPRRHSPGRHRSANHRPGPEAVRERAGGNRRDLREVVGAEHLHWFRRRSSRRRTARPSCARC